MAEHKEEREIGRRHLRNTNLAEVSIGYLKGERIAYLSSWTLALLGIVEIAAGEFTRSVGLTADGIDSMSDALVSFLVWLGLKISRRTPDERFHFGYYKVESFVAFVGAIGLIGIAGANPVSVISGLPRP